MGSLFTFAVLGLPGGMLGVAWPVLRHDFGQPLASLGELLLASVAGYLAVASVTGWALRRLGAATMLMASAVTAAAGTAVFLAARWWLVLIVASAVLGAAGGGLDAALNTAVALAGRTRLMNLIHAAFGVGAAMGPLMVTAALAVTSSWRAAYSLLLVLEVCLAAVWVALRNAFAVLPRPSDPVLGSHRSHAGRLSGNRQLMLLGPSLAVFFCYAGLEIAIASWAASFLRGPDGLPATLAGATVFGYWAGLTTGRVGAAGLGPRLSAENAAFAGTAGAIAGAVGVWVNIAPAVTVTSFIVIGLALGPIFPALVSLTPARVGSAAAVNAVGWQLAAAGLGGAGLSALVGVVLQLAGLASFGLVLVLFAVVLCGLNLLVEKRALAARPGAGVAGRAGRPGRSC